MTEQRAPDTVGINEKRIEDDISLLIRTRKGLLILLGCAHAGLINILEHVEKLTGEREIHAIVGGTHLGYATEEQVEKTLKALKGYPLQLLVASHCTGFEVAARIGREFPKVFRFSHVGFTLSF